MAGITSGRLNIREVTPPPRERRAKVVTRVRIPRGTTGCKRDTVANNQAIQVTVPADLLKDPSQSLLIWFRVTDCHSGRATVFTHAPSGIGISDSMSVDS